MARKPCPAMRLTDVSPAALPSFAFGADAVVYCVAELVR